VKIAVALAILAITSLIATGAALAYKPNPWVCQARTPDGQCIITVSIGNSFDPIDHQVILEVMANFSESPNIEVVEANGGNGDVSIVQGCYKGTCGFLTDLQTRKVYIDRQWSYANYCCNSHDGMRGVYCHELMHAIAGIGHPARLEPSCFNGTSPYLGVEDFADIARAYPLPS
jgi:hypothetical protein